MDLSQAAAVVDVLYQDLSGTLDASTACGAAKTMAAGKAAAGTLKCHALALRRGMAPSLDCLTKAEARLTTAFAAAEARGGCNSTGDAGTVAGVVQSFAGSVVAALGNP